MLYVTSNNNILVGTTDEESELNCGTAPNGYVTLLKASKNFEVIYSTLLASRMADKKVTIRIIEDSELCDIAYVVSKD